VWLVLKWSEAARREEEQLRGNQSHLFRLNANRYLVLIAFLFGMAIGVHLLSLLAFFFVALIVFFTEFDKEHWSTQQRWLRIVGAGAISSALFFAIYPGIIVGLPKLFKAVGAPFLTAVVLALGLGYGVYTTHKRRMSVANLAFMCVTVIFIGYASYALVFVRSATDPPIDMNDPDTIEKFISYLEREQYGSTPLLQGVTYNDQTGRVNRRDGESTLFPRRHSVDPQHWEVYKRYDSDLEFFLDYQIGHMYLRYFLWNFSGRASDVQGAPWMTGVPALDQHVKPASTLQTPSEKESRNVYFALPLLLGLFGAFYHFGRDWRRAFSVFVLFFVTGIGIIIYLNQTPMQPRERHYSYVGSFFAFSLWIGIGAGGILQPMGTWDVSGQPKDPVFSVNYLALVMDRVFRGEDRPFTVGETSYAEGMRSEIVQVSPAGGVNEVRFTFDVPLEHESLRWLRWEGRAFVEFDPPIPGESIELPANSLAGLMNP